MTHSTTTRPARTTPLAVTVTGAAGGISYALLFRIAAGEMFGPDRPVSLRLLEIPSAVRAAEGVAMELQDGGFPLLDSVEVFDDVAAAFQGCHQALLIGSRPRAAGMDRRDLLESNAAIFSAQGTAINECAAESVRVLAVGNPANTNALVAASHAPDVPLERFTALTRLDHQRAISLLAATTGVGAGEIERVSIWGNHSAAQVPDLWHATVSGRPAPEVLVERGLGRRWYEEDFVPAVARRGAEIIRVRGASSVASAAYAALLHVRDWWLGTPEGDWTSMAVASDGSYGVEEGLISSFPVVAGNGDYEICHGLELVESVRKRLRASTDELREERDAVAALGLLGPRARRIPGS